MNRESHLLTTSGLVFSETEKNGWVTKVNSYVDVVTNQIKKENIFHAMYLHAFLQYNKKKRQVVLLQSQALEN